MKIVLDIDDEELDELKQALHGQFSAVSYLVPRGLATPGQIKRIQSLQEKFNAAVDISPRLEDLRSCISRLDGGQMNRDSQEAYDICDSIERSVN